MLFFDAVYASMRAPAFPVAAQVDTSGSVLHVAVCNGNDAFAVSEGAAQLLSSGAALLGCDAAAFSSVELINPDGPAGTAAPRQISRMVSAAVLDATPALQGMRVGTVSVLAAAALMPVRNGFVWDETKQAFQLEPSLRQVHLGWEHEQQHEGAGTGLHAWLCFRVPGRVLNASPAVFGQY